MQSSSAPGVTEQPGRRASVLGGAASRRLLGRTLGTTHGGCCRACAPATAALRGSISELCGGLPAQGEGARASGAREPGGERGDCAGSGAGVTEAPAPPRLRSPVARGGPSGPGSLSKASRSRLGERLILFVAGGEDGIAGFRDLPRPSEAKELGFKPSAFGILNLKTSLNIVLPTTKNWAFVISLCFTTPAQGLDRVGCVDPVSLYLL